MGGFSEPLKKAFCLLRGSKRALRGFPHLPLSKAFPLQVLLNDLKQTVDFFLIVEEKVKLEDVANYQEILDKISKT
jgi:hypothetical protein